MKEISKTLPFNSAELEAIFTYILIGVKQALHKGYDCSLPGLGTFVSYNNQIYFLPNKDIDDQIRTGKGIEKIFLKLKKRRKL